MTVKHSLLARVSGLLMLIALVLAGCGGSPSAAGGSAGGSPGQLTVHLGYFPNITHAPAIVGVANGTFKQALGANISLDTKTFNAGPALIEALLAGAIDIGYVGPNPAVNGYVKSKGEALRVIAGAASGGALFIVRPGAHIQSAQDLGGKKFATPQLGGTQDISLRHYLKQHGLQTADKGGTVQVVPTDNANILTLFKQGQIDGAWVPEPWASRLIVEDQGQVFVDERTLWPNSQFITTVVVVRKAFLDQHPDLVAKFLQAHIEAVQYIKEHPDNARTIVNDEIARITGAKGLAPQVLESAFSHLDVTYNPLQQTFLQSADNAYQLGFLGNTKPNLQDIFYLTPLNAALTAKGLPAVGS